MVLNIEKPGEQDQEFSQEWLVNTDPDKHVHLSLDIRESDQQ